MSYPKQRVNESNEHYFWKVFVGRNLGVIFRGLRLVGVERRIIPRCIPDVLAFDDRRKEYVIIEIVRGTAHIGYMSPLRFMAEGRKARMIVVLIEGASLKAAEKFKKSAKKLYKVNVEITNEKELMGRYNRCHRRTL